MDEARRLVTAALKKSRYRVLTETSVDGSGLHLYADRDRWSKLVTFLSHAALVMLILTAAGVAEKNKVSFERDFERLAGRIRDNLASGARGAGGELEV